MEIRAGLRKDRRKDGTSDRLSKNRRKDWTPERRKEKTLRRTRDVMFRVLLK